jgi:hypothetical protein
VSSFDHYLVRIMPYPRNRYAKMMYEARLARKLFSAPGAFNFRPTWRRPSAGLPSSMYRRHAARATESLMARKLFSKPSAFRFRPKWRGVKRKRVQRKRVGNNSAKRRRFRY